MADMRQRSVDAGRRLLSDYDEESQTEKTKAEKYGRPTQRRFRCWSVLSFAILAVALVVVAGVVAIAQTNFRLTSDAITGASSSQHSHNIARLSPTLHSFRQPSTIRLYWRITTGLRRPDGVLKPVYLINDQFPGPTIELRSGDRLVVQVENALQDEETSIHWHGLSMKGYNRMDGAAAVTQKAILPGQTFEYDFKIDQEQYGTFLYHAHAGVQKGDGLYGGLVVHQPKNQSESSKVKAEHLVMVGDWYHRSAQDALDFFSHPGGFGNEAVPDSILVNGRGRYECSQAVPARPIDCQIEELDETPVFSLAPNRPNLVRLINVGSYAGFGMEIADTHLTVVAVDGGNHVQPQSARSIGTLHPGERVDLLVESTRAEKPSESLTIALDTTFFKYPNPALTPVHEFSIEAPQSSQLGSGDADVLQKLELSTLRSVMTNGVAERADETLVLYAVTQKLAQLDNQPFGFINSTRWLPQSFPPEPLVDLDRSLWDKYQFVPRVDFKPENPLWVDIVLNNLDEEGHPFHLHGHDFWVLSTYSSEFNWGSYNPFEDKIKPGGEFDLGTAIKKDTVYVPRRGYAVLRFRADNPGIWMFHCHVLWHHGSGMAMAIEVAAS